MLRLLSFRHLSIIYEEGLWIHTFSQEQNQVLQVVDESKFNPLLFAVLVWCSFIIIFDGYDLVVYGAVIPSLSKLWSLKPSVAGLIGSLTLIGSLLGALICGIWADKIGRKKVIVYCVALFGVFTLLTGFATGPTDFGIYRFTAGLGLGGVAPLVVALTAEYSPKSMRSLMVGIMYSGYSIGGILVAILGLNVIPTLGWQWMFFFGALPLLLVPILIKFMPESLAYYAAKGQHAKVRAILQRLNHPYKVNGNRMGFRHRPFRCDFRTDYRRSAVGVKLT